MAFADTQQLIVQLDLKGNLSSGLRGVSGQLKAFDKATSRTQKSLGKFGSNIQKGVAIGLTAAAGGFVAVVKAASDYESAFAGVRKTVTATEPELQKLSDQFRALAKVIPVSAAELARLGEAGGALGIATKDLEEFVRVTALLGVTTDLTADEAANSLGILGNVLHLTGEEYSQFASSLVALGNAGASTESQIIGIAERAGAAGELIGLSTAQVLGFSSAVASIGVETEAGGSALQKFFIDTTKFVAEGSDELKLFAKVAGTSAKAFKRAYEKDAGAALQDFLEGLGKLDQAAQLRVLEDLGFNDVRITRTLLGLANNTTLLASQMNVASEAFKNNSALTKEAEQRFKTFDSQLQITKNVLTDIGITIGSKLLPKLTPLLQKLNAFVSTHQGDIEKFGDDLAKGFESFATAIGKVDWTPFIDGMRLTSDGIKTVITAFQTLPADVQKLIVAGVAINKVTGGLITSVTKDLAGAVFHFALDRGSSPANPLFVTGVGPGLPGGPGGGTPGGPSGIITPAIGAGVVFDKEQIQQFIQGELQKTNPGEVQLKEIVHQFHRLNDETIQNTASSERLEAMFGPKVTAAAYLGVHATERSEQIASQKAAEIKSQLAAGDTRSEMAAQRIASEVRNKDLSVTTNITVPVRVSIQETIKTQTTFKQYFKTQS